MIEFDLVIDAKRQTTRKVRFVSEHFSTHLLRADWEQAGAVDKAAEDALIARCVEAMPRVGAVVLSDYAKGALTPRVVRDVIAAANALKKPVVVDPKGNPKSACPSTVPRSVSVPRQSPLAPAADRVNQQHQRDAKRTQQKEGANDSLIDVALSMHIINPTIARMHPLTRLPPHSQSAANHQHQHQHQNQIRIEIRIRSSIRQQHLKSPIPHSCRLSSIDPANPASSPSNCPVRRCTPTQLKHSKLATSLHPSFVFRK